jgi:hypothetical protein
MSETAVVPPVPNSTDPLISTLGAQIVSGIEAIIEANKTLLADESGTGVREIDKALKEYKGDDKEIAKAVADQEKARESFKKAQEKARNLFRTKVLGEDEQEESDVDKEVVQKQRKLTMEAVNLVKQYAEQNNQPEVVKWAETLSIPQVGRQGTSTVGGRKPRAYVTVNGTTHNSFGEAAKAASVLLSTEDAKVEVTSPDLVSAWDEAKKDEFEFQGLKVKVAEKEKKAAAAA